MLLKSKLSSIYHQLIADKILEIDLPNENLADCNNCHHCLSANSIHYNTKCCTYHPFIPNYMIGAILSDDNPMINQGRKRIKQKISQKLGITPLGIFAPVDFYNKYTLQTNSGLPFKNQKDANALRCPFYDEGSCTIWAHRTGMCSTYFCFSSGGTKGKSFWTEFLKYFNSIEHNIALHALQKLNYPLIKISSYAKTPKENSVESVGGKVDKNKYQDVWGKWTEQEEMFYKLCYEAIKHSSQETVSSLLGIEDKIQEDKILLKAELFSNSIIPDYLKLNDTLKINITSNMQVELILKNKSRFVNPIQYKLFLLFDGKMSTYEIVRKGGVLNQNISGLISTFIEDNFLLPIE